ncbi:MAG: hypothetical protein H7062_06355 [Candidatus Saccharimonas sp.]|nr:hypothetical protein [Planctomycetaceae bacterium]
MNHDDQQDRTLIFADRPSFKSAKISVNQRFKFGGQENECQTPVPSIFPLLVAHFSAELFSEHWFMRIGGRVECQRAAGGFVDESVCREASFDDV